MIVIEWELIVKLRVTKEFFVIIKYAQYVNIRRSLIMLFDMWLVALL